MSSVDDRLLLLRYGMITYQLQQQQQTGVDGGWRAGDVGLGTANTPPSPALPKACNECKILRKEVQEIKQCFQSLMYQLLLSNNGSNNPEAMAAALSTLNNSGVNRKRSAPAPSQPECPVALRPINSCSLTSPFVPQWSPWLFPPTVRPPSPTLPVPVQETSEGKQWSSPSSVDSAGHKTDSSSGDSANIDPVGIDASESSSTSSTSTQAMITSPMQQPFNFVQKELQSSILFPPGVPSEPKPSFAYSVPKTTAPVAATLPNGQSSNCERRVRKQISDDYVKLIRQHDISGKKISDIQIPVPESICDSAFRPVSEQQIIQQIVQSKRYEDMDVRECMTQLCKKLAEKRVFGSKLMAQTTVAGPNHSTYSNLPDDGIIYIQHVCRKVLGDKVKSEDEFWDIFRDAMRKLAARCRRVRHAKKTKWIKEEAIHLAQTQDFSTELIKRENEWAETLASLPTTGDRPSPVNELARLFPDTVSSPPKQTNSVFPQLP